MPQLQTPIPQRVNIIFRGLFLFIERQEYIDVLIPNMGVDHSYRAGYFLSETDLAPRPMNEPYRLAYVNGGSDRYPSGTYVKADCRTSLTSNDVYARIVVPTPNKITTYRKADLSGVSAISDPVHIVSPGANQTPIGLFGVHIFHYTSVFSDVHKVRLYPHCSTFSSAKERWQRDLNDPLNIHVIASERSSDIAYDGRHASMGTEKALSLLNLPDTLTPFDPSDQGSTPTLTTESVNSARADGPPPWQQDDNGVMACEKLSLAEIQQQITSQAVCSWRKPPHCWPPDGYKLHPLNNIPFDCFSLVASTLSR